MTPQAKLAAFSAALCGVGYIALAATGTETHWLGALAAHAFEGAMVGVLCDFIAVRNVFLQAQSNFDGLAESLGNVVARDLLQIEALLSDPAARVTETWKKQVRPQLVDKLVEVDLRGWLVGTGDGGDARPGPAIARVVAGCLEQIGDSDRLAGRIADVIQESAGSLTLADLGLPRDAAKLEAQLTEVWRRTPRAKVVEWMVSLDLRTELFENSAGSSPLATVRARKVVADCIRHANRDAKTLGRLRNAAIEKIPGFKGMLAGWFVGGSDFAEILGKVADALETSADSNSELGQAALAYVRGYLDGWHQQPAGLRVAAAGDVVDAVAPTVIKHLAEALAAAGPKVEIRPAVEWLTDRQRIQNGIAILAKWIRRLPYAPATPSVGVGAVAADVALEWLDAWHGLAESIRRRAVNDFIGAFEPYVLDAISGAAEGANGTDLQRKIATMVTDRIKASGKENLVSMLRTQAGPKLDWIKVNGLVYGALFGAISGLVALGIAAVTHR